VASYADKLKAQAAVKKVAGVRAIANDIEVRLGRPAQRSDREIAAAATNALLANVSVPASLVTVIVKDGWITLEGKVALWYQNFGRPQECGDNECLHARRCSVHLAPRTAL
jgi:osmotically-inducible protein OsmY